MTREELNYLISEKIRIDKRLLVVYGKDLTEPILNAIKIAGRLEQAKEYSRRRKCKHCFDFDDCTEVNTICDKVGWYIDGYNDAIADIRGDNND